MKVLTKEDVPGFIEKMRKLCEEEKADEFWENYHANVDNINHIIKTERQLGKKEGKLIGKREGIKEGEEIKTYEIVKNMLNGKLPIEKIMLYSGLTEKQILSIKNNLINEELVTSVEKEKNVIIPL